MNPCYGCDVGTFNLEDPVLIPAPAKPRGCLISRDPTVKFREPYKEYKAGNGLLWFNAPPAWLCNNIREFMEYPEDARALRRIRDFLNHECYWTHLHKCPTCKTAAKGDCDYGYHPFSYERAKTCADFWFDREFAGHRLYDAVIVALGRDVDRYFSQWLERNPEIDRENIIVLPHPSKANIGTGWSWNRNAQEKETVRAEIERLVEMI